MKGARIYLSINQIMDQVRCWLPSTHPSTHGKAKICKTFLPDFLPHKGCQRLSKAFKISALSTLPGTAAALELLSGKTLLLPGVRRGGYREPKLRRIILFEFISATAIQTLTKIGLSWEREWQDWRGGRCSVFFYDAMFSDS